MLIRTNEKKHMETKNIFQLLAFLFCVNSLWFIECSNKPLLITTVPKSGTHLLSKAIKLMTGQQAFWGKDVDTVNPWELNSIYDNQFYLLHAICTPYNYDLIKYRNFKVILMIRDPRDVLISWAHWLKESPGNKGFYECHTLSDLISCLIKNYRLSHLETQTLVEFFEQYLCWLQYPDVYITSFEKLVGPLGGGDQISQENEIINLSTFLDIPLKQPKIKKISKALFGDTATFRQGKIGSWKEELTFKQKQALKCIPRFTGLLIKLGYEKDNNW